ncbi:PrsW family intramembrane metalloprotease [Demequina muriae]|uniref:PrsW family glutamic-type intramembrane protease n=1 Tax=Demequina muriae TaxID=3051664 RepID=A0ABT8GGF8_9MICO|nr:PrsW family glutamic-type intramembrane protease [Demequina sp. EGI L300058]MDN4480351.1 PrsW family glutamic-type intramembrane protease [Demequina sp. EGI L300058]
MNAREPQPLTVTLSALPRMSPRTASFIDVRSWVFWAGAALTVFGIWRWTPLVISGLSGSPTTGVLSAILWLLYGLVFLVLLYRLELFERRSPATVFGALLWGALAGPGMGVIAAPAMHDLVAAAIGSDNPWVPSFAAPLVEEPLKLLGVLALALIPGARVRSAADGLFYGAVVGLGFQVSEGFLYTATFGAESGTNTVTAMFLLRGIIGGLWSHATFAAVAGAGLGYFFNATADLKRRTGVLCGTVALSIALHGFFDAPVLGTNPFVNSVVKGLPVFLLFLAVLRWAHLRERRTFAGLAAHVVPDDLVSPGDFSTLATRRARRRARRWARRRGGYITARALKRLQGAQLSLLTAVHEDGWGSPRTVELSRDVRILAATLDRRQAEADSRR